MYQPQPHWSLSVIWLTERYHSSMKDDKVLHQISQYKEPWLVFVIDIFIEWHAAISNIYTWFFKSFVNSNDCLVCENVIPFSWSEVRKQTIFRQRFWLESRKQIENNSPKPTIISDCWSFSRYWQQPPSLNKNAIGHCHWTDIKRKKKTATTKNKNNKKQNKKIIKTRIILINADETQ